MKALTAKVKIVLVITFLLGSVSAVRAQFTDCSTGLLQMPTAEMQPDGTFMITNNYLNRHTLSPVGWDYNTFQYGFSISFWERIEVGYVCTLFNSTWRPNYDKTKNQLIIKNQDRHFVGRVCIFHEGDFGLKWLPSFVLGVSDPMTGSGDAEYTSMDDVAGEGNGYFNRNYVAFTKHFSTHWGSIGVHAGYQFNRRSDYPINAPFFGVNWRPVWLQEKGLLDALDVIAEFDSRTVNIGILVSIWRNHFEAMFELQDFRWISFGLRYKIRLMGP